jgi:hypothetical protein
VLTGPCARWAGFADGTGSVRKSPFAHEICTMDVEHINAIGNHLADLSRRTQDLRGYL